MPTFHYANPEVIHWGAGCVREKLDSELRRVGGRRVFVVTTKSAVREPALAPAVEALLGDRFAGRFADIGQHAPEIPRDAQNLTGVPLDGSGQAERRGKQSRRFHVLLELAKRRRPVRRVRSSTHPEELAGSAGFSAEGTKEKVGVAAPELRPAAVFYDADLAVRTPLDLWLTTGIRAVDHAVETLLAPGEHPLPDVAALDGLRRLRKGLLATKANPADKAARTECQLGAWHSYLLPGPAAKGLSHTLGKRLGSRHDIPHGVSSCLLLPHVLRYLAPEAPETMKRIAEALEAPTAAEGVARLVSQLGLPNHLAAYKLSEDDLREAVRPVASADHSENDLLGILRAAL